MKQLLHQFNNWFDQVQEALRTLFLNTISIIDPQKPYFVSNYFKTKYKKRALLSYVVEPFIIPTKTKHYYSHSNNAEALVIAKTLRQHKFQVDIIKYDATHISISSKAKYHLIFGLSPNIDRFYKKSPKAIFVPYTTGSSSNFQNQAEKTRLTQLNQRIGKTLKRHMATPSDTKTLVKAKHIIGIGNKFTKSTFPLSIQNKMNLITVSAYSFYPWPQIKPKKNFLKAKTNFLYKF